MWVVFGIVSEQVNDFTNDLACYEMQLISYGLTTYLLRVIPHKITRYIDLYVCLKQKKKQRAIINYDKF